MSCVDEIKRELKESDGLLSKNRNDANLSGTNQNEK